MPRLSVLLPVRNAAPWLAASLASLRRQTFADFEIVAVNDGSDDDSGGRLERAARAEPRLRVLHTPPRGLPAALNTALAAARGSRIARHDADDLAHRRRFAVQSGWLDAHPHDAVVGSRVRLFPAAATGPGMRRWIEWHNALLTHDAMAAEILIDSPLAHGTAMMRRAALERVGGWRERGWPEDLDLWIRLLESGARFAKCPEVLYGWRQHPGSATRRDPRYEPARFLELKCEALRRGFLRRATRVHVAGVGTSLERWRAALDALGLETNAHPARRPDPAVAKQRPLVLVLGQRVARARWRAVLLASDMRELHDFIFVA